MKIPTHKLHDIRRLLYTDRPSYTQGITSPITDEFGTGMLENDEVLNRLINEVLDILEVDKHLYIIETNAGIRKS